MGEVIIPPDIRPESPVEITPIDDMTSVFSPRYGRGSEQRQIDGDPRWGMKLRYRGLRQADRARLRAAVLEARGKYNTIRVSPAQALRGSFPATEMFTNNTFANGTTGWTTSGSSLLSFSVQDQVAVLNPVSLLQPGIYQEPTFTQGVPYALRLFLRDGEGSAGLVVGPFLSDAGSITLAAYASTRGLRVLSFVPGTTGAGTAWPYVMAALSGYIPGHCTTFLEYASLGRCALVDGGGNYMLQSDDASTTWSTTNVTVSSNAHTSPDGTATADGLIENSSSGFHFIQQTYTRTSAIEDWCAYADVARPSGSRNCTLSLSDGTGSASVIVDLGTGSAGTVSLSSGVTNGRAFVVSLGNGWYRCFLVARLQSTTIVNFQVLLNNGVNNYTGDGSSRIAVWHMGANRTSVPSRPTITTTTVVPADTSSGVGYVYLKGLPVSTSGLLLSGDWFEINGELKMATASLDSDASGCGYLQFRPSLVRAPADNDPVIVLNPMGRFILPEGPPMNELYGQYTDVELNLQEFYT